jgi:hypothetical protein
MPVYEIEQYEIHTQKFQVKAGSKAEAIKKLFDGRAEAVDEGSDLIEVARGIGLPAQDHRSLADALRRRGVAVDDVIPSIRSIEGLD